MFCTDQETSEALNSLTTITENKTHPIVIWVGAGVSAWAGYPLWPDLAAKMHTIFSREVHGYDKNTSSRLLNEAKYPDLFEQMRLANQPRYFTLLSNNFCPKRHNSVYLRFIRTLRKLPAVFIVTTNVDEALEHSLPELVTVQRSDIERIPQLLDKRTPFVCKLHGSASSVKSMIFSNSDYEAIKQNDCYIDTVRSVLSNATVLFLGYGFRDEYLFHILHESTSGRPIFGTGPHFIVTSEERIDLPATVRRIRYVAEVKDHRDSLQALETILEFSPKQVIQTTYENADSATVTQSLYFIADLIPPGTWTTSHTLDITTQSGSGDAKQMIIGEGYIDGEVTLHDYSALHDIVVGLICFDVVCVSIDHLDRVHNLLGSNAFWVFVSSNSLRLVLPPSVPTVLFLDKYAPVGYLAVTVVGSRSNTETFTPRSISERIRTGISPTPGKEKEAETLFNYLESTVIDASKSQLSDSISAKTRGALMHPAIKRMLGVSGGTPRNAIPRWLVFPILRLARVVTNGLICQHIGANATRMIWGSEKLANVAFAATEGKEWADSAASYVLTGQFNSDIGSIIKQDPDLLMGILKFRESSAGNDFRQEVSQCLATNDGGQIVSAINSGLRQSIPISVLQKARDQLSALFISRNPVSTLTPAVWGDLRNSDVRIEGWRKRSLAMLKDELKRQKLGPYNECPCGSGESVKFCCQAALSKPIRIGTV